MNADQRLHELFQKYTDNSISGDEYKEFWSLLDLQGRHNDLSAELQMLWEQSAREKIMLPDEAWDAKMQYLKDQQNLATAGKTSRRSIAWVYRLTAAACVIGILLSGAYYLFIHKPEQPPVAANDHRNDVPPGGNKATLTLAGGSTIMLDSADLGNIAQQGNVNIIKTDSGALAYNILKKPELLLYNTLSTPRGGQYQLTLPDGTRVWLNAASSIKYPIAFIGKDRTVEITGEAYFEVKHDASFPFKVKTKSMIIEDIGTSFNVNAYDDETNVKTTLLEGSVSISLKGNEVVLKPGQQAVVSAHSPMAINYSPDLDEVMAWKNGSFAFADADLTAVMRQLARWYDVDVVYDGSIPDRQFNGKIGKMLTLDQVLKVLTTTTRVHYTIEGKKLTIRP